jgi:predicted Rossmann-fold nucleotide-binding protein
LLNPAGYFDALIQFVDHSVAEGYMRQTHRDILLIDADPDALLDRLEAYEPPEIPKWITGAGDT